MFVYERDQYYESHRLGPSWGWWLLWVLATTLGAAIGLGLGDLVEQTLKSGGVPDAGAFAVAGASAGVPLGIAQGVVLWPFIRAKGSLQWLLVTIAGRSGRWIVTASLFDLMGGLTNAFAGLARPDMANFEIQCFNGLLRIIYLALLALMWGSSGAVLGLAQWTIFRRRAHHAEWWIAANAGATAMAGLVTWVWLSDATTDLLIGGAFFGIMQGALTGFSLIYLLRHPTSRAEWQLGWHPERSLVPQEDTVLGSELYKNNKLP
jgi:hypothetical protein